jgi:hypothetical protein
MKQITLKDNRILSVKKEYSCDVCSNKIYIGLINNIQYLYFDE